MCSQIKTRRSHAFILLILVVLPACVSWSDAEKFPAVVWSDDGEEIAVARALMEESGGLMNKPSRNYRSEILIGPKGSESIAGTNFTPLTGTLPGTFSTHFFYMRSAGYIVAGRMIDEYAEGAAEGSVDLGYVVEKIDLDGNIETIARADPVYGCIEEEKDSAFGSITPTATSLFAAGGPVIVMPNWDGSVLAKVDLICSNNSFQLSFLNADDLSVRKEASIHQLSNSTESVAWYSWRWTPDDSFIAAIAPEGTLVSGLRFRLNEEPETLNAQSEICMFPLTSSSNLKGDSVLDVEWGEENDWSVVSYPIADFLEMNCF